MQRFYTAIIEKAKDGFGVFFPDLPGCTSFGKSVEAAAANAYSAAQAHVALAREYGDDIAEPRSPDEIPAEKGVKEKARLLIPVEMSDKPVRVNISLPGAALEALDRTAKELSLSRSGAIAYLALESRAMNPTNPKDFVVDLEERTATHKSGVVYGFREYPNEQDWKDAAPYFASGEDQLYAGHKPSLRRAAKTAATSAGMKREKR